MSQPQYVVNKQTNTMMEPTLAMHSLINVQRKTEPVTIQKQVDGKQQMQTTQVQRTPDHCARTIYYTISSCQYNHD